MHVGAILKILQVWIRWSASIFALWMIRACKNSLHNFELSRLDCMITLVINTLLKSTKKQQNIQYSYSFDIFIVICLFFFLLTFFDIYSYLNNSIEFRVGLKLISLLLNTYIGLLYLFTLSATSSFHAYPRSRETIIGPLKIRRFWQICVLRKKLCCLTLKNNGLREYFKIGKIRRSPDKSGEMVSLGKYLINRMNI